MYVLFYYVTISGPKAKQCFSDKIAHKSQCVPTRNKQWWSTAQRCSWKKKELNTCTVKTWLLDTNWGRGGAMNEEIRWEGMSPDKKDHKWLDGCLQAFSAGWEKWSHQSFCAADLREFNELALPKHRLWAACWLSNKLHFTENKSGSLKP